jgi:hypothetical protein
MENNTDVRPIDARLWMLPATLRVPLKFGAQVVTHVTCARVELTVADRSGRHASGWGETPLSASWGWPSASPLRVREAAMEMYRHRDGQIDLGTLREAGSRYQTSQIARSLPEPRASFAETC